MASLGRPGDVLGSGAIVGAAPGQLIVAGIVFIPKSRLRRALRLGWRENKNVFVNSNGDIITSLVVVER